MTTNPDAVLSIAAYRPKPGKEAELLSLAREHVPFLRKLGLVTDRASVLATSSDGTIVEVFEWVKGGIERAHSVPELMELWGRFTVACDFVPLNTLQECGTMFANFVPIEQPAAA